MHSTSGRWRLGLALALVTAVCWGLLPIALRIVLDGMDAWTITWYRFAVSAAVLGAFLAWRRRLPLPPRFARGGWTLFAVALAGLLGNYVLYLLSLEHTGPTAAQVLIQIAPVFLLFGGLVVFGERFAPVQWGGFVVLLCGLLLFFHDRLGEIFSPGTELGLGVVVMIVAALSWAIYGLAQKKLLARLASGQVLFLLYLFAVPLLLPAADIARVASLDPLQRWMLVFCCANTVIAYGCFAEALEHWEVSRVSAVVTVAPLFTLAGMHLASRIWPDRLAADSLTWVALVGALLVVTGAMTTAVGARAVSGDATRNRPRA